MSKAKFSTTLKCQGCVDNLSKHIDQVENIQSWKVDLDSKKKWLEVEGEGFNKEEVIAAVKNAGFEAKEKRGIFG